MFVVAMTFLSGNATCVINLLLLLFGNTTRNVYVLYLHFLHIFDRSKKIYFVVMLLDTCNLIIIFSFSEIHNYTINVSTTPLNVDEKVKPCCI